MKLLPANGLLTLLLLPSLWMVRADFPNCQLGSNSVDDGSDKEKQTFALKTKDGEEAGSLTLSIDQASGQIRFDSFSKEGYRMYDQQIWFDEALYQHEMPQDPSSFFMKDTRPMGTSKWIGMWVVNPFYCGPRSMVLAFHSTMKLSTKAGAEVVDVYAYNPGGDEADDNEDDSIHQATFQLSCTPCDEWEEPEPWTGLAGTKPKILQDIDDVGKGGGKDSRPSSSGGSPGESGSSSSGGGTKSSGWRTRAGPWAKTGSAEREDTRTGVSTSTGETVRHYTNTGTAERPIIDDSDVVPICLAQYNHQGAVCQDLVSKIWKHGDQVVGDLCVSVNFVTNLLQVTLTPLEGYTLLRGQLWTGNNGIGDMPAKEGRSTGIPNTNAFPHYQCTSKGTNKMRWELHMADQCGKRGNGSLDVTVVAHAIVAPKETDGTVIPERGLDAFATEIDVDVAPVRFGYMTVNLDCNRGCEMKRGGLLRRRH